MELILEFEKLSYFDFWIPKLHPGNNPYWLLTIDGYKTQKFYTHSNPVWIPYFQIDFVSFGQNTKFGHPSTKS